MVDTGPAQSVPFVMTTAPPTLCSTLQTRHTKDVPSALKTVTGTAVRTTFWRTTGTNCVMLVGSDVVGATVGDLAVEH